MKEKGKRGLQATPEAALLHPVLGNTWSAKRKWQLGARVELRECTCSMDHQAATVSVTELKPEKRGSGIHTPGKWEIV